MSTIPGVFRRRAAETLAMPLDPVFLSRLQRHMLCGGQLIFPTGRAYEFLSS
ncbi:MAG: hypothetical protein ACREDL_25310 [Bradyrhizobium sp.]